MSLESKDVHAYTIPQLMDLFTLAPGFTEEALQLSRQKLVAELPKLRPTSITHPHEVALFIDCACNRLRDEHAGEADGTWSQTANPLIKGAGGRVVQSDPNSIAGRKQPIVGGRRAETGAVPPGWLNPISVRTVDFAVNVDSRFRDNYHSTSSTDWKMELPVTQGKVSSMRVASLQLPLSSYAISHSRGTATMLIVGAGTGTVSAWRVILPDGNYDTRWDSTEAGEAHLKNAMDAAIGAARHGHYHTTNGTFQLHGSIAPPSIDFNIDKASGKAYFTGDEKAPYTVVFAVDKEGNRDLRNNLQLKLGWQLGFRMGFYEVEQGSSSRAMSESICAPYGPHYAYLAIDDGNNNHGSTLIASFGASSFSRNIMLRVNLGAEASANGVYKYMSKAGIASSWWRSREYFGPVTISKLGFKLFDEYGRIIDLNGMDWSMALVFESIYD